MSFDDDIDEAEWQRELDLVANSSPVPEEDPAALSLATSESDGEHSIYSMQTSIS